MATLVPSTLGEMRADIKDWLGGENISDSRINSAISDAIETSWMEMVLAALNIFMGGPINITIPAASERVQITTIVDPTVAPAIAQVASGTLAAHTVYVAYTYVTESGSETLPSPITSLAVSINNVASVGTPAVAQGAIGWNCYTFVTGGAPPATTAGFAKQNDDPIPFNSAFQELDSGWQNPTGQNQFTPPPVENTTADNVAWIQHFEFKTSSGMYQPYNAGDIDSVTMRRLSTIIGTASEFQAYGFDLINQRQLEIRPAAGITFVPRYFYIIKPRRLMFDASPLPFPNVPTTKYYRAQSLSDLFLSIHEYPAAEAWEIKAKGELQKMIRSVSRINTNRNMYVAAFLH